MLFYSLVYTADKKKSSNDEVFAQLIKELNELSEKGITIMVNNTVKRVKFQLVLILGDNLGLNGIFGFVQSFNCNYFCRICTATLKEAQVLTKEDQTKLRTRNSYDLHVQQKDASKTGVRERCVSHNVTDFHIVDNVTVDIMHDVLEGICPYVMNAILKTFIFTTKLFTLQTLNTRIENFDYGPENSNKPPPIAINRLLNYNDLKMLASEMLCFVRYFGVMVGDLIPKNDQHYKLYQYLRQILDIVMYPRVVRSDMKRLELSIENLTSFM